MEKKDLDHLSELSRGLWWNTSFSEKMAQEAVAAVSLFDLTRERATERVAQAMFERAQADAFSATEWLKLSERKKPFFQLSPEERLVLVLLHRSFWSYQKIATIIKKSIPEVEEIAWKARVQLGADQVYPVGTSTVSSDCPEYLNHRPWTQRFFDEEISTKGELIFIQHHLAVCDYCRRCLNYCRDLYFKVDQEVNRATGDVSQASKTLAHLVKNRPNRRLSFPVLFLKSIYKLFMQWDIACLTIAAIVYWYIRKFI